MAPRKPIQETPRKPIIMLPPPSRAPKLELELKGVASKSKKKKKPTLRSRPVVKKEKIKKVVNFHDLETWRVFVK